jgi:predicted small secreted protein
MDVMKVKALIVAAIAIAALLLTACGAANNDGAGFPGNQNIALAHATGGQAGGQDSRDISSGDELDPDRMRNQNRSLAILDEIHAQFPTDSWGQPCYPDYLGGVYLDDDGRLTVMMAESDSPEAREFLAALDEWVQVRTTTFTHQELTGLINWLNDRSDQVTEFAAGWGLDTVGNSVYLEMIRYSDEEINRFRSEVIDSPMLKFRDPRANVGIDHDRPLRINPDLAGVVVMSVTEVTKSKVTIAIQNNSDLPVFTGYDHMLEVHDDEGWRFIPSVFGVNSLAVTVGADEPFEMTIDLEEYLHIITPGLFRIRKGVMIDVYEMSDGSPSKAPIDTFHEVLAEFNWSGE